MTNYFLFTPINAFINLIAKQALMDSSYNQILFKQQKFSQSPTKNKSFYGILAAKPHKYQSTSPKYTYNNYNQFIQQSPRSKGRYRLRNCRQPHLQLRYMSNYNKHVDLDMLKDESASYSELKQLMNSQMERSSLTKKYQNIIQYIKDSDVSDKLKSELVYISSTTRIPHKNRYKSNKKSQSYQKSRILVNGNKIQEKKSFSNLQNCDEQEQINLQKKASIPSFLKNINTQQKNNIFKQKNQELLKEIYNSSIQNAKKVKFNNKINIVNKRCKKKNSEDDISITGWNE